MSEHGNNAAMREALRTLRQRFDNDVVAYQDRYFKFSGWHWHKKAKEAAKWRDVFYELREACDSALSKPPRNCDKHANVKDAKTAWFNYKMSCPTPPGGWGDVDLLDWFLSPAEGEKKENSHDNT